MKLLLVGNHSCSNRGDAAITRGLMKYLESQNASFDVYSRYPFGASQILNVEVLDDETKTTLDPSSLSYRAFRKFLSRVGIDPITLLLWAACYVPAFKAILPVGVKKILEDMAKSDAIVQVGGSFFVDLYGASQYRLMLCSIISGKPIYLLGHSLGPFNGYLYKKLAGWCLSRAENIVLRDEVSCELFRSSFPELSYIYGADTAWLVPSSKNTTKEKTVAITVRELAPFDTRLGITQTEYEGVIERLCMHLISLGYSIKFFSTCTSFDNYHKDDRTVAHSIVDRLDQESQKFVEVIDDELTDVELGEELSRCSFTVGTRLHSCIISMNFGTPAIAISYEHKSIGLYEAMGISDYVFDLANVDESTLHSKVLSLADNEVVGKFDSAVAAQRELAVQGIQSSMFETAAT